MEDLLALAAEGALGSPLPRSPEAFQAAAMKAKGSWHDAATRIGRALDETLEHLAEIRRWLEAHRGDRNHAPVVRDLDEQLAWLLRGRFAWRAGFARLIGYPRYFKAIRSRLGRVDSLPLVKDLEKSERFRKLWEPWLREWTARSDDPRLWDHGWQLEEFRISLFAPDVPVVGKVSEKKLAGFAGVTG